VSEMSVGWIRYALVAVVDRGAFVYFKPNLANEANWCQSFSFIETLRYRPER